MTETLVRFDSLMGMEVPRCDIPEEDVLRIIRTRMHAVEVHTEPGKQMVVEVRLPYSDWTDITIEVDDCCLRIRVDRPEDREGQKYLVRGSSSFHRSLILPPEAKSHLLKADFREGTLRVTVPLA
jgi:HSP20 family molecular chaperone IbpA